jgi:hypothetical protein
MRLKSAFPGLGIGVARSASHFKRLRVERRRKTGAPFISFPQLEIKQL